MTFTTLPIFEAMNAHFGRDIARGAICGLDSQFNFSRITATPDQLDASFGAAMAAVGATQVAIPRAFQVPGDIVNLAAGHGYTGDAGNPNPPGMGLVTGTGLPLAVTYADAPAALIVHPQSCVTAAVSGIWHLLAGGSVNQTLALMEQEATYVGVQMSVADLWINLAPGANHESFQIDGAGRDKILALGEKYDAFVYPVLGYLKPYMLDLSGLFYQLWVDRGVPRDQIAYDSRNTMTARDEQGNLILPSKCTAEELGYPGYSSGIQIVRITGHAA